MSQNFVPETLKVQRQNYSLNKNKNERPKFIIPAKDTTVSHYAKMLGMSDEEFMKWTGLKSNVIKKGTKIPLPMDTVPQGKGIYALARKYNMSIEEFCKLNKIPKPYNEYKAKKDEEFYVKPYKLDSAKQKKQTAPSAPPVKELSKALSPDDELFSGAAGGVLLGAVPINNAQWGSSFTPKEIADKLEYEANDKWGAVGKKPFDDMLREINPKNVSAVLKEYADANDGRSLINRITSEITSKQSARKDAVMHIYDALAEEKFIPAENRKAFVQELDKQFDSFGMVNTEKLDAMIDEMLSKEVTQAQVITNNYSPVATNPDTKIKLTKKSGVYTAKQLQKDAIKSAQNEAGENFKQYCKDNNISYSDDKLDLSPLKRIPAPVVSNGKIVTAETELLAPTTTPNGKVVILNPGHGGYSSRTGYFDTGSYSFIKKANGKYAPLLEYEKMNIYAESTTDKLRSKGYAVIITNGHAQTISDQNSVSNIINKLETGAKGGKKYSKKDIVFVSLHADSQPGMSGTGICYDSRFENDSVLADTLKSNLNSDDWISASLSERNWNVPKKGLQVLHQSEQIPSVLVEVEYVNGSKCQNLDSYNFQNRFENKLIAGLDEYFNLQ